MQTELFSIFCNHVSGTLFPFDVQLVMMEWNACICVAELRSIRIALQIFMFYNF